MDNLTRSQVRYICFRIQQELDGGNKAEVAFLNEVKIHLESEDAFDGWDRFGKTWDVCEKAPLVAELRKRSIQSEWNLEIEKTAKDLPK